MSGQPTVHRRQIEGLDVVVLGPQQQLSISPERGEDLAVISFRRSVWAVAIAVRSPRLCRFIRRNTRGADRC